MLHVYVCVDFIALDTKEREREHSWRKFLDSPLPSFSSSSSTFLCIPLVPYHPSNIFAFNSNSSIHTIHLVSLLFFDHFHDSQAPTSIRLINEVVAAAAHVSGVYFYVACVCVDVCVWFADYLSILPISIDFEHPHTHTHPHAHCNAFEYVCMCPYMDAIRNFLYICTFAAIDHWPIRCIGIAIGCKLKLFRHVSSSLLLPFSFFFSFLLPCVLWMPLTHTVYMQLFVVVHVRLRLQFPHFTIIYTYINSILQH